MVDAQRDAQSQYRHSQVAQSPRARPLRAHSGAFSFPFRRRGRRPKPRRIIADIAPREFYTADAMEAVVLSPAEVEAIRLVDLMGMRLGDAAQSLGVSRSTAWRIVRSARRKLADAMVNGKRIVVKGRAQSA